MGCKMSKCCLRVSKRNQYDPDQHVIIRTKENDESSIEKMDLTLMQRTGIENPNADLSDLVIANTPQLERDRTATESVSSTTNSTVTVEAKDAIRLPSSSSNSPNTNPKKSENVNTEEDENASEGSIVINEEKAATATSSARPKSNFQPPVIKITPANPRLESFTSSESEADQGDRLRVPDSESDDSDEDDDDDEIIILPDYNGMMQLRSTGSLPLENIDEENSEYNSDSSDDVQKNSDQQKDSDLLNPDSYQKKLQRCWSFDSNQDLVEREFSLSDNEDEKGSLQEKLYEEIVQRFGPDPEFDEKLEKKLLQRRKQNNMEENQKPDHNSESQNREVVVAQNIEATNSKKINIIVEHRSKNDINEVPSSDEKNSIPISKSVPLNESDKIPIDNSIIQVHPNENVQTKFNQESQNRIDDNYVNNIVIDTPGNINNTNQHENGLNTYDLHKINASTPNLPNYIEETSELPKQESVISKWKSLEILQNLETKSNDLSNEKKVGSLHNNAMKPKLTNKIIILDEAIIFQDENVDETGSSKGLKIATQQQQQQQITNQEPILHTENTPELSPMEKNLAEAKTTLVLENNYTEMNSTDSTHLSRNTKQESQIKLDEFNTLNYKTEFSSTNNLMEKQVYESLSLTIESKSFSHDDVSKISNDNHLKQKKSLNHTVKFRLPDERTENGPIHVKVPPTETALKNSAPSVKDSNQIILNGNPTANSSDNTYENDSPNNQTSYQIIIKPTTNGSQNHQMDFDGRMVENDLTEYELHNNENKNTFDDDMEQLNDEPKTTKVIHFQRSEEDHHPTSDSESASMRFEPGFSHARNELRPMSVSVELNPSTSNFRSSFHSLIIIPVKEKPNKEMEN